MDVTCLITGATGFVGGHLAESCLTRGWRVRALIRPASDASRLQALGVDIRRGDLADPAAVTSAAGGVEFIFHCAARVGDWGSLDEYRAVNVHPLRTLLEASRTSQLKRFVLLSSLGVYPAQHHHGTTEDEPLPDSHVDSYTTTKVEAERLALDYHQRHFIPLTILRPGFIYGPRDRTLLPRLIENLRLRRVRYIGSGSLAMNCIYVKNLVEAFFLAVDYPKGDGQAYNLTDGERVTKRRFVEAVCDGLDLSRPSAIPVPFWVARLVTWWLESRARKRGATEAPRLTQARLKFLGLNLDFSIEKARNELGFRPQFNFNEGMTQTLGWFRENREAPSFSREHAGERGVSTPQSPDSGR
jgi:nucleoside-diphosphate-sugar epimerase